jgi:hypothetical protein
MPRAAMDSSCKHAQLMQCCGLLLQAAAAAAARLEASTTVGVGASGTAKAASDSCYKGKKVLAATSPRQPETAAARVDEAPWAAVREQFAAAKPRAPMPEHPLSCCKPKRQRQPEEAAASPKAARDTCCKYTKLL